MQQNDLPQSTIHRGVLRSARRNEPRSIVKLVEVVERDYQFKLGYLVIQSLIQSASTTVEIDSGDVRMSGPFAGARQMAGGRARERAGKEEPTDAILSGQAGDVMRVDRLRDNLQEVWTQSLPHAVRAFAFGRAAFEKTYLFDSATGLQLVAGLDYLPPEHTELVLDDAGRFAGVKLEAGDDEVTLGPERAWWFALDPTATEPHGRSRYLGAPQEIWRARRKLEEEERIWYSKFAIGHGVARAPDRVSPPPVYQDGPPTPGEIIDPMEVLRRELSAIESGGTLILSSKTYADGKYHYDYQESEGQRDSTPLEHRRQMLDVAALRSLGIPERAITQDDRTGSRAIAQVHIEVLYRTAEGILDQIAASFDRYVIAKAVEVNWPDGSRPGHRVRWEGLAKRG